MKNIIILRNFFLMFVFFIFPLFGCTPLIATYDKVAYEKATSLKVETLSLLDKANSSYSLNKIEIDRLRLNINKAFEYSKGRPKSRIITEQWSIMKDPNRSLLGGFLKRWKDKGSISNVIILESKKNISLGFDQIIGLESGLIKLESSE